GIGDPAFVNAHTDRAAPGAADQPVVDLQLAALPVTRVPECRERATATLDIARGQVVEHEPVTVPAGAREVPARERALDPVLTLKQPIHRTEQLGLGHLPEIELVRERCLRKAPGR